MSLRSPRVFHPVSDAASSENFPTHCANVCSVTIISRCATGDPRHKCGPAPNARCRFGVRSSTQRSASANTSGSRFAAPNDSATISPFGMCCPCSSISCAALRPKIWIGELQRSNSSTASEIRSGSSRRRCQSAGCSAR